MSLLNAFHFVQVYLSFALQFWKCEWYRDRALARSHVTRFFFFSIITVFLRFLKCERFTLFVPRRYYVPTRTFHHVPERLRPFFDQKSSETVKTRLGKLESLKHFQTHVHVSKTKGTLHLNGYTNAYEL